MIEKSAAYLGYSEADKFPSGSQMRIITGNNSKHEGADEEALNLDPATTKYLNEENGEEVPRHVASRSNDEISICVLEEGLVFRFTFGEPNCGQKHRLVEVETVKGDVDEEPGGCSTDELLQMSPLAEVNHESLHLDVLGRRRNMRFDDRCVSIFGHGVFI